MLKRKCLKYCVSGFRTPLRVLASSLNHLRRTSSSESRRGERMAGSYLPPIPPTVINNFSPYRKLSPTCLGTYVTSAIPEPLPKSVTEEASSRELQLASSVSLIAAVTLSPRVVVAAAALSARKSSAVTLKPFPDRLLLNRSLA